ncbi:MAG: thioredoxin [Bdellovibrionales bacterium]|nr:thioredoxin [Bdellovibrionales bacterium]
MAQTKNVLQATDDNFQTEILGGEELALVDFWAEWCGPCRMLAPTIESLAEQYSGKLKVYKMNVDENPTTPTQFNIRGIPTVILFKGGKPVDQLVGNQPKEAFIQAIEKQI